MRLEERWPAQRKRKRAPAERIETGKRCVHRVVHREVRIAIDDACE